MWYLLMMNVLSSLSPDTSLKEFVIRRCRESWESLAFKPVHFDCWSEAFSTYQVKSDTICSPMTYPLLARSILWTVEWMSLCASVICNGCYVMWALRMSNICLSCVGLWRTNKVRFHWETKCDCNVTICQMILRVTIISPCVMNL